MAGRNLPSANFLSGEYKQIRVTERRRGVEYGDSDTYLPSPTECLSNALDAICESVRGLSLERGVKVLSTFEIIDE